MDIDASLSQLPRNLRVLLAAITRSQVLIGFYPHWRLCADKPSVFPGRQDACPVKAELNLPHGYYFFFKMGFFLTKPRKADPRREAKARTGISQFSHWRASLLSENLVSFSLNFSEECRINTTNTSKWCSTWLHEFDGCVGFAGCCC